MLGWLADYSFPFGQAFELLLACFKGTISSRINTLQQQLQRVELVSQPDNTQQVQKLNILESQAWLYQGILERLGEDSAANHEKIARTIEALESKRNEILEELKPRRPQKYRTFVSIQDHARSLLASQAEKDYDRLEKIVTNVILFTRDTQPSRTIFSEVIARVAVEIAQNANKISPYRLRLAYKIADLIKMLYTKIILEVDGATNNKKSQEIIDELQSKIIILSRQFNNLIKDKKGNNDKLNRQIQEITNLTRTISDLHRDISNRDSQVAALRRNTQDLAETAQRRQSKIDELQNSILDLQRSIQNSDERNQSKQDQIQDLQDQLYQLKEQKLAIQNQVENVINSSSAKIRRLQSEKYQLDTENLELQRQYQALVQQYEQQQDEIARLRSRIENISQQSTKNIETRGRISLEDYKKISNQSDYVYVKAYTRKDGTPVTEYYRRRPR